MAVAVAIARRADPDGSRSIPTSRSQSIGLEVALDLEVEVALDLEVEVTEQRRRWAIARVRAAQAAFCNSL